MRRFGQTLAKWVCIGLGGLTSIFTVLMVIGAIWNVSPEYPRDTWITSALTYFFSAVAMWLCVVAIHKFEKFKDST